jgi:hypothetical protein
MSRTVALMPALAVVTAGVLAAGSSGPRETQRTIGLGDYLASGHTFVSGQYNVGEPVGTVNDATDMELPLGRPVTITKANLGKYACK